jgi:hypothetical protein
MSSAAHRAQPPPADRAPIASTLAPVAPPVTAPSLRVPWTRTGAPGFAVGAAAWLFAVLVVFLLFALLLALML